MKQDHIILNTIDEQIIISDNSYDQLLEEFAKDVIVPELKMIIEQDDDFKGEK